MNIPVGAETIIRELERNGYSAFIVGGCVRDTLMGRTPEDWDITTDALPNEIKAVFSGYRTIDTGIRYGTVGVVAGGDMYEVTTFRSDGDYSDKRRPDSVSFESDITRDLARRDLTINAVAYNPKTGYVDPFGGAEDIKRKLIKTVNNPEERFVEDALRIARAFRFACTFGFDIEENTYSAMINNADSLSFVAKERINKEFTKTLLAPHFATTCLKYHAVLPIMVNELNGTDAAVFDETVQKAALAKNLAVKLAILFSTAVKSPEDMRKLLRKYACDNRTVSLVCFLCENAKTPLLKDRIYLKKLLGKFGESRTRLLLEYKKAQNGGADYTDAEMIIDSIIENGECRSLSTLAFNGKDAEEMGFVQGPVIKKILDDALDSVIKNETENTKEKISEYVKKKYK